ncbi:hypothetical protein ACIRS1_32620 [Kitasatospora sp. NPDC101176]|uniref:hypothetical protein n=1 Tax=Kitasatospora sp. NPDC101176 TaxID=3364099 RepID=UPI00381C3620
MPTRQLGQQHPVTAPPAAARPGRPPDVRGDSPPDPPSGSPSGSPSDVAPDFAPEASREPVLLGDVLFHALAEIARRAPESRFPAQRTRPHP